MLTKTLFNSVILITALLLFHGTSGADVPVENWIARYNGPANSQDYAGGIALDPSGNVCVTGRSTGAGSDYDYATVMYSSTTGISLQDPMSQPGVDLHVNPNPVCNSAGISVFSIEPSYCELMVFDLYGRLVETLHCGALPEGEHEFTWQISRIPAGVYLLRATFSSNEISSRIVVLR
ncbi:MAG: T9SS type A sorting domain-containing protein [Candidatus Aegiribacteria sp.]|nr:T9SS type A sorting domain-containing protein [Candidatus Aegiribacteria sp.]